MVASDRWQDWASFTLGLWLAVSPWVLGYATHETATTNAAFVGLALALGAHFAASFRAVCVEWLTMLGGAWLVAAPFVLGFTAPAVAAASCIAVGVLVVALGASACALDKEIGRLWHRRSRVAGRG